MFPPAAEPCKGSGGEDRAAGDALATAHILLRLLDELEIHGVRTLAGARKFHLRKHGQAALQLALDS